MGTVKAITADKKLSAVIDKAAKINSKIKNLEVQLNTIKESLKITPTGKYITNAGHSLTVSETTKFSDISPEKAKKALRDRRQGKFFIECIKVAITPLKRYLSDSEISELREEVGVSRRYTFK